MRLRLGCDVGLASANEVAAVYDALVERVCALDAPVQVLGLPVATATAAAGADEGRRAVRARVTEWLPLPAGATGPGGPALGDEPDALRAVFPAHPVAERATSVELPGGRVGRVLALTRWPAAVRGDWLSGALSGHAGCVIALHVLPVDPSSAARLLRRRLAQLQSAAAVDERTGRLADAPSSVAAESAATLLDRVTRARTAVSRVQVLLAVDAADERELDARERALRAALAASGAGARLLRYEQAPAWGGCRPGGGPVGHPPAPSWRLLPADVVAATVPLPVGTPVGVGIPAGVDTRSGLDVRCDRFAWHNASRIVVGTSGAGKSYAAKLEVHRWVTAGVEALVVDPEGEFAPLAHGAGGVVFRVGEPGEGVDPVALACAPGLPPAEGLTLLTCVVQALLDARLAAVDVAALAWALDVLRADGGAHGLRVLAEVLADLCRDPSMRTCTLPARLIAVTTSRLGELFGGPSRSMQPAPVTVFDLRSVPPSLRPAVAATVLGLAWSRAAHDAGSVRRLVVVDEAHLLLTDPAAADLLAQFARRARKYRVGLELVTQRLSDFLGCATGEAVLANTAAKLLLGCEDHERAAVVAGLQLSAAEAALLRPGRVGAGLLVTPGRRVAVQVGADAVEHAVASAGPRGAHSC